MRIYSVEAIDSQTNDKQTFVFACSDSGKKVVTNKGGKLNKYLEFCFFDDAACDRDVETLFSVNGEKFALKKTHGEEGIIKTSLKLEIDGRMQLVARGKNVAKYIEERIHEQLSDLLKLDYVSNKAAENFHGDLNRFHETELLINVLKNIRQTNEGAKKKRDSAKQNVHELSDGGFSSVTKADVEKYRALLAEKTREVIALSSELGELKVTRTADVFTGELMNELSFAQDEYSRLAEGKNEIEERRRQLKVRDEVAALVPKVSHLRTLAEQKGDYEKKRYALVSELEWQENELANVSAQLEEKQRQSAGVINKRSKIEVINQELCAIAELYEKNKTLNELLVKLNEQSERLTAEKVLYKNKMDAIEKSIDEIKVNIDAFQVPNKSIGELLETVRVDVKMDEVTAQIEKLQSEIAVKDSQIAEKESNLVMQVKRFKSVAELDVTVAPIKAKDTILQVLDTKFNKLEVINSSLAEKKRNLERALEDYRYRILQLEHSRSKLVGELEKVRLKKQEEFKREVFLNSQKVYSDDVSAVFAVTTNLNDEEVATLQKEIDRRNIDRDVLLEKASLLQGKIDEINRQTEINNAEMETLRREKGNINSRYNEIISQNRSESVFNYLKALESNGGTKYLLDVQQDAVRSEAELTELKRYNESLRTKLAGLQSRIRYLAETQKQLDSTQSSIDHLVSTNDEMKEELSDIGQRLAANYEQYRAVSSELEEVEGKLNSLTATIVETGKTIRVNEQQIEASTEKAKKYAGSDDLEQAITTFKYEIADVESERQMLADSKQSVEREVFKKRLELEKTQWLFESKSKEYDELYEQLQFEFNLKGLSVEQIDAVNFDDDSEKMRKAVAEYDARRSALAEKIDNFYTILKSQHPDTVRAVDPKLQSKIDEAETTLVRLKEEQEYLEEKAEETIAAYVAASGKKMKLAAAVAEVETYSGVKDVLEQNELMELLVKDKLKACLGAAESYLRVFTDDDYSLEADENGLTITIGDNKFTYDELEPKLKIIVYLSVLLGVPHTDDSDGRWLVFEERLNIEKDKLNSMLAKVDNVGYVVDYMETK